MKISIVIPVYNEAEHLAACLEAIARQSIEPHEVIVVDNNSTDGTAGLAQSYSFVKYLFEPRQGVVHARNRGFKAATGDIIGRIDADTVLPANWIRQLEIIFSKGEISAVSGSAHYYDFALAGVADTLDGYFRDHLARALGANNFLWGANMAVRRSDWLKVQQQLCNRGWIHEDFDLAIHLQEQAFKVAYDPWLNAGVSSRRIDTGFRDYIRYTLRSPQTYAQHRLLSRLHMYPVILVCWLAYVPGRVIYRGYDPVTRNFSWAQLLNGSAARVDPTANVITG